MLLTLGRQQSFYLLARLFARPGTVVGVEEPGFRDPRNAFTHEGAQVLSLPEDKLDRVLSEIGNGFHLAPAGGGLGVGLFAALDRKSVV